MDYSAVPNSDIDAQIDWVYINDMTLDLRMVMVDYNCNDNRWYTLNVFTEC